jgi:two-component system, NtrC family, sensor kinase
MKSVFLILSVILCFQTNVSAQDNVLNPVVIKDIPTGGIVLDRGWKFHPGDNPDWSKPGLDDRDWQIIDPTTDIHDLPQISNARVGWFRLHIIIDSSISKSPLALIIQQSGASELFVNGELFYRFGVLGDGNQKTKAYDPLSKPILFSVNSNTDLVLAVRLALQPNIFYTKTIGRQNSAFSISINNFTASIDNYLGAVSKSRSLSFFRAGLFFLLFILHSAFFIFYPLRRANLYFCLYAFVALLGEITDLNVFWELHDVEYVFYGHNLSLGLYQITNLLILTALYSLFEQKRTWVYWVLMGLTFSGIVLNLVAYNWGYLFSIFFIGNLLNIEIVRTTFNSILDKKRGAWIIAAGAISFLVFYVGFLLPFDYQDITIVSAYTLGDLFYNLANLAIPISTSIYLGLDFAFTNATLKQKLDEVKNLGDKNLAQEKEKQQLLAAQNELLESQVNERTISLSKSLQELRETQSQLIQSEKMASLGELTAGIAHEIQNPLNFVNNFSEVNKELLTEMEEAIQKGDYEEVKTIARDISENQDKISQHGKRAESIVKGMLQHSRVSSGQKEPTDINALCDEYLRLAYHGLRAKDKSFNARFETDFDTSLPKINIVPQDIGRVVLNLINNAFYAVNERLRQAQPDSRYEPTVTVSTKRLSPAGGGKGVEISVKDNGNGIPDHIKEKIFQPFFTTKPTGQGTGLGLSLSYDIVTKGHNGHLELATGDDGSGAEFIIILPIN